MEWQGSVHARLDAAIARAEERTDAEIVVAIERLSGSYRDVDHVAGALVAASVLAVLLGVHLGFFDLPEEWVVAPVVAAYVAAVLVSRRTFALRRLLTSRARRAAQVKSAARVAFVEEKVHATRTRNGVLFYFSDLENGVEVVPDHGVQGRIDDATWHTISRDLEQAAREDALAPAIEKALARVTAILEARLPRTEPKAQDEVARRLRVRS